MNAGSTRCRDARGKSKARGAKTSPLVWWRSVPAMGFDSVAVAAMRGTIANIELLREPLWRDAVAGDATSAFKLALSIASSGPCQAKLDIAMTALVICAYEGSPVACVVAASVISRLKGVRGKDDLAHSWALRASVILEGQAAPRTTE